MYSTLQKILLQAETNIQQQQPKKEVSIIIVVRKNDKIEKIENIILKTRKYAKEIYLFIELENEELIEKYEHPTSGVNIIINEQECSFFSVVCLEYVVKRVINDQIIFVTSDAENLCNKLSALTSIDATMAFFMKKDGHVIQDVFQINKWNIRFYLQMLRMTARESFFDLIRITPELVAILHDEKIQLEAKPHMKIEESFIYPIISVSFSIDTQTVVRTIAILSSLIDELVNNEQITSTFRVNQLLATSLKFQQIGHYFLGNILLEFCAKYINRIKSLPPGWDIERISSLGIEGLIQECNYFNELQFYEIIEICNKDKQIFEILNKTA
ncbi:MAG: hypothetical protein ACTSYD_06205 [Candidatus Heimdallarchaeaceae archaeon]